MQSDSSPTSQPAGGRPPRQATPRLLGALALIGVAIASLAVVDRLRERPATALPPHEPAQALITPPEAPAPAGTMPPPLPPQVVNDEVPPAPGEARSTAAPAPPAPAAARPTGGRPYMVQIGVFSSAANAHALQKQLKRAGMDAHLETRVQLGPFKDKEQAEKALARARKLGINAVLVPPR